MHPTIAMYLAKARALDIAAEAARIQIAKSVRSQQPDLTHATRWGLGLRGLIPMFRGRTAGAATA
jgi:hypothetical protein